MNNITMDDIKQDRPPEKDSCFYCDVEFKFGEKRVCDGGAGWTRFDYHPKCFKLSRGEGGKG